MYLHNTRSARSKQILECYGDTSLLQDDDLLKGEEELQLTATRDDVDYESSFKDQYKQLLDSMNKQILAIADVQ